MASGDESGARWRWSPGSLMQSHFALLMALAATLLSFGLIIIVADLTSDGLEELFNAHERGETTVLYDFWTDPAILWGGGLSGAGALLAILAFGYFQPADDDRPEARLTSYNMTLMGLGFALALLGVLNFVALAGFASVGELHLILNDTTEDPSLNDVRDMMRMLLIPGFAALGSLFFVAGALRRKRQMLMQEIARLEARNGSPADRYDSAQFWGGLWYRMGEAVLFALVFYLAVRSDYINVGEVNRVWVLLVALLVGMFVKPAEQLINGLALRLFEGIKAMLK